MKGFFLVACGGGGGKELMAIISSEKRCFSFAGTERSQNMEHVSPNRKGAE